MTVPKPMNAWRKFIMCEGVEAVDALHASGLTMREIGERYGVSYAVVWNAIHRVSPYNATVKGVAPPSQGGHRAGNRTPAAIPDSVRPTVLALSKQGHRVPAIAAALHVTAPQVRHALKCARASEATA